MYFLLFIHLHSITFGVFCKPVLEAVYMCFGIFSGFQNTNIENMILLKETLELSPSTIHKGSLINTCGYMIVLLKFQWYS